MVVGDNVKLRGANANANADANTNTNSDTNTNSNADTNTDSDADTNTDAADFTGRVIDRAGELCTC